MVKPLNKIFATGIGSMPNVDAASALDTVFSCVPDIPFWPQLPRRDLREGMVAQFSENLPCLRVTRDGVFFDGRDCDAKLEAFYEKIIARDVGYFRIGPEYAAGFHGFVERLKERQGEKALFLKCHITGPFTFCASVNDHNQKPLLHDEVFFQAYLKGLAMKALWQIETLAEFGKKIILFIDEPYLSCFGSAFTPVTREQVTAGLTDLVSSVTSEQVTIGIHCCGNTDWSLFTDIPGLDIINFDAYGFFDKLALYAPDLKRFYKRGGTLCWGIVPTQDFAGQDEKLLRGKLEEALNILETKGIERSLLRDNLLVSPSCGMAQLSASTALQILSTLKKLVSIS